MTRDSGEESLTPIQARIDGGLTEASAGIKKEDLGRYLKGRIDRSCRAIGCQAEEGERITVTPIVLD